MLKTLPLVLLIACSACSRFGFDLLNDATTGTGDKQLYTDYTSAVLDMTSARSP